MKRLTAAALSAILLAGCGSGTKGNVSARSAAPSAPEAIEATASENTDTSTAESRIIYRERLYNTDSYTKSDLIIQTDGKVWCGFYMHNEGSIDRFNRLWTSDEEYSEDYQLDDDRWLAAVISESKDDDFMLFGETLELESLSSDAASKLNTLISEADPFCASNVRTASPDEAEPAVLETEYDFIDLVTNGEIYRVYEYTQSHERTVQDEKAAEAVELVHNCSFYSQWREKCTEYLVPFD